MASIFFIMNELLVLIVGSPLSGVSVQGVVCLFA